MSSVPCALQTYNSDKLESKHKNIEVILYKEAKCSTLGVEIAVLTHLTLFNIVITILLLVHLPLTQVQEKQVDM